MKAFIFFVAIVMGALLTVIGAVVAILAFTGYLPMASTDVVETSMGNASLTTGNVAVVVLFFGIVLIIVTLSRVGKLT